MKVAVIIPEVRVADCGFNADEIISHIRVAARKGVQISAFPELAVTGYSCGDLFAQELLIDAALRALARILEATVRNDMIVAVGMPIATDGMLFNAAVIVQGGRIWGIIPKTYLPNYREFQEKRWFTSATGCCKQAMQLLGQTVPIGADLLFSTPETTFGVEICEDLWAPVPPSSFLTVQGAEIILNPSASPEGTGKYSYLRSLVALQSARTLSAYAYVSCGFGESSTDVVFGGKGLICELGVMRAESKRFCLSGQMDVADIDLDLLRQERLASAAFAACRAQMAHKEVRRVTIL